MNTLKELVRQLNLRPTSMEQQFGRNGNLVLITNDGEYQTYNDIEWAYIAAIIHKGFVVKVHSKEIEELYEIEAELTKGVTK